MLLPLHLNLQNRRPDGPDEQHHESRRDLAMIADVRDTEEMAEMFVLMRTNT